jgi:hypothetical protein
MGNQEEFYVGRWAGQISASHERGGTSHFDQTFLAYQLGDWNLRIGSLNQWWGPAQSRSLIMSNNARPIPSISLSRSQTTRSESKWLQILGPWFFTTQVGQSEREGVTLDDKLWMTRFNFTPIPGLELGFSWSAMWNGKSQPKSVSEWSEVVTFQTKCIGGEASCDVILDSKLINHIVGFDFKYSVMVFEQPFSLYGQHIGEDAEDYYQSTDSNNLLGVSTYFLGSKVYIEASESNVACGNSGSDTKNCYEHGTYPSGYRYHNRAIVSTFDTDAKTFSIGINKHFSNGNLFELVLNRLTTNETQQKISPVLNGTSGEIFRLSGFYQVHYGDWLVKLGTSIEHTELTDVESKTNALVFADFKYRLN